MSTRFLMLRAPHPSPILETLWQSWYWHQPGACDTAAYPPGAPDLDIYGVSKTFLSLSALPLVRTVKYGGYTGIPLFMATIMYARNGKLQTTRRRGLRFREQTWRTKTENDMENEGDN